MRRAIRNCTPVLILLALTLPATRARAAGIQAIDGTGIIDYTRAPEFKIGDWIKYHITGKSEAGLSDDYLVTVLIAGEERFWGDDAFWVETWLEPKVGARRAYATLISYSIFDDPAPLPHLKLYFRKFISGVSRAGMPRQRCFVPTSDWLTSRDTSEFADYQKDTLGIDSLTVATGSYECRKVLWHFPGMGQIDRGDSTYNEGVDQYRTRYISAKIPITSLVREEMVNVSQQMAWKVGQSKDARTVIFDRAKGSAELVGFGSGLKSVMIPDASRKSRPRSSRDGSGGKPGRAGKSGK